MKFCAGLLLTVTNWVAPVTRLTAVTPSSGWVPAPLTFGTAGTGWPLPQPSSLLAAHLPFGAMASPREKSPRLYRIPAGRTYRPSGSTVAPLGMCGWTTLLGAAALAVWGTQYAPASAKSDSAVAPASQRETLPRRRRTVPKNAMAMRSFAMKMKWTVAGEATVARPTVQAVDNTGHRRAECCLEVTYRWRRGSPGVHDADAQAAPGRPFSSSV